MKSPLTLVLLGSVLPAIALPPLSLRGAEPSPTLVYFGTYTSSSSRSKGIYVAKLDLRSGQLGPAQLAGEATDPSFVAIDPNQHFLYAVAETSSFGGQKSGAVAAFAIDPPSGQLTLLNQQPSGGSGPCHVTVDPSGKNVLIANYTSGSCAVFPIEAGGKLGSRTAFMQHRGSSVNKQRQEGPHAHGIYLDPRNRFAFVPDLGLDKVFIYQFDPAHGTLVENDPPFAAVRPGSGPRHFAFRPDGRFAYVINEMLCTITAFTYDAEQGQLKSIQTISTLPADQPLLPSYSTAELEVHPSGKFLYGSNRGHNSIAVFSINPENGQLTLLQHASTQGKIPRGFGIEPSGNYLVAANQDSDNAIPFRIDQLTGRLSPAGPAIQVGSPVCVRFLAPKE